jgi:hypothetical protein
MPGRSRVRGMELRLEAVDVKRALLRGAVCAAVSAAACALLSPIVEERSVPVVLRTEWTLSGFAFLGALLGLMATPLAIVEALLARMPRSRARDVTATVALLLLLTVVPGAASVQAAHTDEILARGTTTAAVASVLDELRGADFLRDAFICAASVAPVALITVLRGRRVTLSLQILGGLSAAMLFSLPVVLHVLETGPRSTWLVTAVLWPFGSGLGFAPLASFADLIAERELGVKVPS